MSLLITFWDGDCTQFDNCDSIEDTLGLFRIYQNHECYDYTRSYAIDHGYEQ